MTIMVGGSGSTGSSLLRTMLNRHPELFTGPELDFFNKEQYYTDWEKYRRYIFALFSTYRGVRATMGWMPAPGHNLLDPSYGWDADDLAPLVYQANTVLEFGDLYFALPLETHGARIWIEKTPSNCYAFPHMLETDPTTRLIHTARNPLDTVASLVARGMHPFWAASRWLYCTAMALRVHEDDRCILVTYESLVDDPGENMKRVTAHIGVEYDSGMLEPSEADTAQHSQHEGWTYSRTDKVQKPKVRRFDRLEPDQQVGVRAALNSVRISDKHVAYHGLLHRTAHDVAGELGYDVEELGATKQEISTWQPAFKSKRRSDMIQRTRMLFPTRVGFYPIDLV